MRLQTQCNDPETEVAQLKKSQECAAVAMKCQNVLRYQLLLRSDSPLCFSALYFYRVEKKQEIILAEGVSADDNPHL